MSASHRRILQAISGLLLAVFVTALSGTIVLNALPRIMDEIGGSQSQYPWVFAAALLAAAASTPVWGKISDRFSKKTLIQASMLIFAAGSILAGSSPTAEALIAFRILQGIGVGGMQTLVFIVLAAIVSPRGRGRYMGYLGAAMATATVAGPLAGGFVVEAPFLGWRWCFWLGVPFAAVALVVLHRTLHLPAQGARATMDWRGAFMLPASITVLLLWVTIAGDQIPWASWVSAVFVGAGVALVAVTVMVERRATDPIVPPRLIRDRTMILVIVSSVSVGVSLLAGLVFFAQYFQIARGYSPVQSGLLSVPMMAGSFLAMTVCGRLVTRFGRWKPYLVGGFGMIVVGVVMLSTIDHSTPLALVCTYMAVLGFGTGASVQNLILAAQNDLDYGDLGAGTSMVTLFQTLGGAAGVSILGAILASRVTALITENLASLRNVDGSSLRVEPGSLELSKIPRAARVAIEQAYASGTALAFRVTVVVALAGFFSVLFIREKPLRTTITGST